MACQPKEIFRRNRYLLDLCVVFLEEKFVNIVIQINGKKKSLIKVEKNLNEKDLLKNIKKDKKISNFLEKKSVFKHIIVKNKLVNLIVK